MGTIFSDEDTWTSVKVLQINGITPHLPFLKKKSRNIIVGIMGNEKLKINLALPLHYNGGNHK